MVGKSEVDAAVAAATRSLAEEPGFAWIKKSGLLERAYFLGLFGGLRGIASEEDIGRILVCAIAKTMFPRSADDSFQSTRTGVLFDSVRRELLREDVDRAALLAAIQRLADHVDALDREWNSRVRHTRMLLETGGQSSQATGRDANAEEDAEQRDRQRHENHRWAEELEHFARHLALIETDHKIWKRLEE
ncbi:MAG: hypothetical protein ACT4NU_11905 [Chromatiales bacterium]